MTLKQRMSFVHVIGELVRTKGITQFHHGCCLGVDLEAEAIVSEMDRSILIVRHVPTNMSLARLKPIESIAVVERPPLPYLERNKKIVLAADLLLVLPNTIDEQRAGGTWFTKRYAEANEVDYKILWP